MRQNQNEIASKMLAPNCQIFATYVYDAQENNLDGKQWHDSYIT